MRAGVPVEDKLLKKIPSAESHSSGALLFLDYRNFVSKFFFFSRNVYFFFFLKCQLAVLRKKQTQKAAVTRPHPYRLDRLRMIMNESLIYRTFIVAARRRS